MSDIKPKFSTDLPVYYPYSGIRFVMNWWTYDDRGHLAIAKSEEQLLYLARCIFRENPGARIDHLLEVELVVPSASFCDLVAAAIRRAKVSSFFFEVCAEVRLLSKAGLPIPPAFTKCKKYVFAGEGEPYPEDGYYEDYHIDCAQLCTDGILLIGMSKEELYDEYHVKWESLYKVDRVPSKLQPSARPSLARQVEDDTDVRAFIGDYGHHSHAIHLTELAESIYTRPVMFYFRQLRNLDHEPFGQLLQEMLQEESRRNEEKGEALERRLLNESKQRVEECFVKMKAVFG